MDPVPQILEVWQANAGGFVLMALLVFVLAYGLWRVVKKMILNLETRLESCEEKHKHCEAKNQKLERAMIVLTNHHDEATRQQVMTAFLD